MNDTARGAPPSVARVVWLVTLLAMRRFANRVFARWRKPPPTANGGAGGATRLGTARKGRTGRVLIVFFSGLFLFNSVNFATSIVRNAATRAEKRADPDQTLVDDNVMDFVDWADEDREAAKAESSDVRRELRDVFVTYARREGIRDESARRARADGLLRIFDEKGAGGFRRSAVPYSLMPSRLLWYDRVSELDMVVPLGFIGTLIALGVTLIAAFSGNTEIARVETTLEWWFTFPVSPRGLLLARVLSTALVNGLAWFVLFPFYWVSYICAGVGDLSPLLAAGCTVYVGLLAGSVRVFAETALRHWLPLRAVASVQAVLSVLASMLLVGAIASMAPAGFDVQATAAERLPLAAFLNPFSLPLTALIEGRPGRAALVLMPLVAIGSVVATVAAGGRMLRDGLVTSFTEAQGTRRTWLQIPVRRSAFRAILHKEVISVVRNRTRLGQTLLAPVLVGVVQLAMNPSLLSDLRHAPRIAAAVSYGVAAFVLSGGATGSLIVEVSAIWMLFTMPRSLDRILVSKAALWAAFAAFVAAAVFAALVFLNPGFRIADARHFLLVPLGVIIQAFVAVALGTLGTDPFATDARRQLRPSMMYLFMLTAGTFGYSLSTPSAWAKFTQLVLSTLLAFALWQKVRDHVPYLLDPTEAPAPEIAVADGIIAALAFFVLQGILAAVFLHEGWSPGKSLLYAFAIAGILVAGLSLIILSQSGLPNIWSALGLRVAGARPSLAIALGLGAGVVAFGAAVAYTALVKHVGWLDQLRQQTFKLSPLDKGSEMVGVFKVLAVCAAPPVEEFIFRGLLYKGLRRSMNALRAGVASALVFALVHPPVAFAPVFVLALFAAAVYERSKLLVGPVVAHATYNALLFAFALQ
jgi:membrane protease YdiL (CAAX protease family)